MHIIVLLCLICFPLDLLASDDNPEQGPVYMTPHTHILRLTYVDVVGTMHVVGHDLNRFPIPDISLDYVKVQRLWKDYTLYQRLTHFQLPASLKSERNINVYVLFATAISEWYESLSTMPPTKRKWAPSITDDCQDMAMYWMRIVPVKFPTYRGPLYGA